jgi:hypothetical protein
MAYIILSKKGILEREHMCEVKTTPK